MAQTINSALRWWAQTTPDGTALSIGGDRLTYRNYHEWTERIAAYLCAIGARGGDRVGICAANSLEYCVLVLGVMRMGGIVATLSWRHTPRELAEQLEEFGPRIVFAGAEYLNKFDNLGVRVFDIAELRALRNGEPVEFNCDLEPDAPIVIVSTSGSTARPKGVVHSHATMTGYAIGHALEDRCHAQGARVLAAAPMSTSSGLVKLLQYTTVGASLFFESHFDGELFLKLLVDEKITTFGGVPVFYERIAACSGFDTADLSHLMTCMTGGAAVPRAMLDRWLKKGITIRQLYGQTEVVGAATLMPRDLAGVYPEKCGRGGIFSEIATVDSDGARCAPGVPGEIIVRGPSVMVGYWNNPEATAEVMLPGGWLRTGDVGVLDEDGMLTFVTRLKDIIISGGLNISAAEVEAVINDLDAVEEVVVFGVPDARFGEAPMAVIYASRPIETAEIIAHCNAMLADFKVPRYVAFESEPLPRTPTGKLSKPPLREKYQAAEQELARVR